MAFLGWGLWETIGTIFTIGLVIGLIFIIKSMIPYDSMGDLGAIWDRFAK